MNAPAQTFFARLRPPPGGGSVPTFASGWLDGNSRQAQPYLRYAEVSGGAWSDDLEELHEESSRDHFMDVLTRDALLDAVSPAVPSDAVVADLGCSTGYLLEDLARRFPGAQLVGVDVVGSGLRKAHGAVPAAALLLADVRDLPIGSETVHAVVSANMLEHVDDDVAALREVRRILVPGGTAALVVPFGRGLYDYYDRFLGHERRYGRGELAAKAHEAGMEVLRDGFLGQFLIPPFWLVKKRNRLLRGRLQGAALQAQVEKDIAGTTNSRIGSVLTQAERRLSRRGLGLPAGIREIVVVRRPRLEAVTP